jgi:hypothetical protein
MSNYFEWTDPDEGTVWEMYYDVPQGGEGTRESVQYRVKGTNTWWELPPFAMPPDEAMEEWHGTVKRSRLSEEDGLTMDDFNDLLGAAYRLMLDLKKIGAIPEQWSFPTN